MNKTDKHGRILNPCLACGTDNHPRDLWEITRASKPSESFLICGDCCETAHRCGVVGEDVLGSDFVSDGHFDALRKFAVLQARHEYNQPAATVATLAGLTVADVAYIELEDKCDDLRDVLKRMTLHFLEARNYTHTEDKLAMIDGGIADELLKEASHILTR